MKKQITIPPLLTILASVFVIILLSVLPSSAGWVNKPTGVTPSEGNLSQFLNVGPEGQSKGAGLEINDYGTALTGLLIFGGANKGRVGIGTNYVDGSAYELTQKLEVVGNINLTDYLKINGASGNAGAVLKIKDGTQMEWGKRTSWLTLIGSVSSDSSCSASFSGETCGAHGFDEYQTTCATGSYAYQVRICYKDF